MGLSEAPAHEHLDFAGEEEHVTLANFTDLEFPSGQSLYGFAHLWIVLQINDANLIKNTAAVGHKTLKARGRYRAHALYRIIPELPKLSSHASGISSGIRIDSSNEATKASAAYRSLDNAWFSGGVEWFKSTVAFHRHVQVETRLLFLRRSRRDS